MSTHLCVVEGVERVNCTVHRRDPLHKTLRVGHLHHDHHHKGNEQNVTRLEALHHSKPHGEQDNHIEWRENVESWKACVRG